MHHRALLSIVVLTACAGIQAPKALPLQSLRATPSMSAEVGYTDATGVPKLAKRVAERPGVKVAVLQVAYRVNGRAEQSFSEVLHSNQWSTTWQTTTTPELRIPGDLALAAAKDATVAFEEELAAAGFDVISHEKVAATDAYAKWYGDNPQGFAVPEGGYWWVAPPPLRIRPPKGVIETAWMGQLWPKADALEDIRDDLGEDVLLLCVKVDVDTFGGGSSQFSMVNSTLVTDPEFAGYGVGGFGHVVTTFNAMTDKQPIDGFVKRDGDQWEVNWTPMYEETRRVHRAFARGIARELHDKAYPPA